MMAQVNVELKMMNFEFKMMNFAFKMESDGAAGDRKREGACGGGGIVRDGGAVVPVQRHITLCQRRTFLPRRTFIDAAVTRQRQRHGALSLGRWDYKWLNLEASPASPAVFSALLHGNQLRLHAPKPTQAVPKCLSDSHILYTRTQANAS